MALASICYRTAIEVPGFIAGHVFTGEAARTTVLSAFVTGAAGERRV
jgi:hypothetical protein